MNTNNQPSNAENPADKQNQIKDSVMKEYQSKIKNGERIDVSKILEEYQDKFSVPKVLIMKWLGLNNQKSLFVQCQGGDNLSQSYFSQDSEYTLSECSPSPRKLPTSSLLKANLGEGLNATRNFGLKSKNSDDNSLERSVNLKPSRFSNDRRTSCRNSLPKMLEILQPVQREKSVEEVTESDSSPKNLKIGLDNVKESNEEDECDQKPVLKESKSKNVIKPDFIIRKKNMPSVRISKFSETPKASEGKKLEGEY